MKAIPKYAVEFTLLGVVAAVSVAGFWNVYFGPGAAPDRHQVMHTAVNFTWLIVLFLQLNLVSKNKFKDHRKVGLLILALGPLLVASTALLSVHSAQKGLASGEGDALIVQNVGVTLELAAIILLGFALKRRRKLHGSLLLSTSVIFMGIALFFTLISFVPAYKIEGPETFYRFQTAGTTGQYICLAVGVLLSLRDFKNSWPFLFAGSTFTLNDWTNTLLVRNKGTAPLTEWVGSMSQPFTFAATFAIVLLLLLATGVGRKKRISAPQLETAST